MWGVLVFGIVSAIQYFRKFWGKVDYSIKHSRRKELLRIERQRKRAARALARSEAEKSAQDAAASS
jgi:CDP-diacylglycerol---glycerol-3-phosphate 3-phosphatidyltransferase